MAIAIGLMSVVASCSSSEEPQAGATEADSTASDGPHSGAPDELCALDPESVYAVVNEGSADHYSLVNLDDPTIVCTLGRSAYRVVLHPANGALLTVRSRGPLLELVELEPDWLRQNFYDEWRPSTDDNDIVIAEVPYYPNMRCPQEDGVVVGDVFTDFTQVYAHCGGEVLNAPELGFDLPVDGIVGRVDGTFIFGGIPFSEAYAAWASNGAQPFPDPVGVDYYYGIASRPDAQGLVVALHVSRDGAGLVSTVERARIDANGLSLTGEVYAHDLAESGFGWLAEHRLDARGNLFALAAADDDGDGRRDDDAPVVVLRLTLEDPPEVVYELPPSDRFVTNLLSTGTAALDVFGLYD